MQADEEEPPTKMKKLAITEEREEDKYDHTLTLKCWLCEAMAGSVIPDALQDPKACTRSTLFSFDPDSLQIKSLADGVMSSLSSARQSEVKAWEEEITACEHTLLLQQESSGPIEASGMRSSPQNPSFSFLARPRTLPVL